MSTDQIDKAIYDKARYESLRKRGISEDRAKRVATVPLQKTEAAARKSGKPLGSATATENIIQPSEASTQLKPENLRP